MKHLIPQIGFLIIIVASLARGSVDIALVILAIQILDAHYIVNEED